MKVMGCILIVSLAIFGLSGCATSYAQPNSVNGKYYMMGDSKCYRYRVMSSRKVMCYDRNGRATGWRRAMTNQELQMYMHRQAQANYSNQQMLNRINYNNQQMQNRFNYNTQVFLGY